MPRNQNPKGPGPSWKPPKDSTEGNDGQAVSEAARTKPKPSAKPKPHGDGQAHQGPK
jgi:hypothetical protein